MDMANHLSPNHTMCELKRYRTSPLKGLWTHQTGGFYHDGRFAILPDVVNHYDTFFGLCSRRWVPTILKCVLRPALRGQ
jgi:hypothetical protein